MSLVSHLVMFVALFVGWACAFAAARIESAVGDVRAGISASQATAVRKNQDVGAGSMVLTGPKSRATLRFQDGQVAALHENTELRIHEYSFSKSEPTKDRSTQELVKGTLRVVSGAMVQRNPQTYRLSTPAVILGVRGTDFMVAVANPTFFTVLSGTITVANSTGTSVFGAGAIGMVPFDTARAATIARGALPEGISNAFTQLALLKLGTDITSTRTAFTKNMSIDEVAVAIKTEMSDNTPLGQIAANALEAGVASGNLTVAMLLAGVDPAIAIGALISSNADAAAVIDAAIAVGVDVKVVSAAAIAAGISPSVVASTIEALGRARSEATPLLGTTGTPGATGGGGGGGPAASPQ